MTIVEQGHFIRKATPDPVASVARIESRAAHLAWHTGELCAY
jgi:hypothetical protein